MPTPVDDRTSGERSWIADFTGRAIVIQWGAGAGGEAGVGGTRGGRGGGPGLMAYEIFDVESGKTYYYFNGAGGVGGVWNGSAGQLGTNGQDSFWRGGSPTGGGTLLRAAGGKNDGSSGSPDDSAGRARVPGTPGVLPTGGNWGGGKGGDAASQGDQLGGLGGAAPGQHVGNPGNSRGGGGSGGGQNSSGDGGNGGVGGTYITQALDTTFPGYYLLGVDTDYNFDSPGPYDDFIAGGDGQCMFEAVGGGGAGKPGNLTAAGGHGGGGGAWAATLRNVYKDVIYRRIVGAGGIGKTYVAQGVGTAGGDSSWTLTPLRIIKKQVINNVAYLWTYHQTASAAQKHGFIVGEQFTVAGVDATFNGTYNVLYVDSALPWNSGTTYAAGARVNTSGGDVYQSLVSSNINHTPSTSPTYWTKVPADRLAVAFTKVVSNTGPTTITPTGTSIGLTNPFVLAKGGQPATGNGTGGTPQPGGLASQCIGDYKTSGGYGRQVPISTTTQGANGGSAALPLGEQAGWGGGTVLSVGDGKAGDPGNTPGGGGGGGRNINGGNGGNGGDGAAVVRWVLSMMGLWVGAEKKDVTRIKIWSGGVAHNVTQVAMWKDGIKRSTLRTKVHPESLQRRYPTYLRSQFADRFDRATGTFNWKEGAPHVLPALLANDFDFVVSGDSVAEGWTSFDGLLTGIKDFPRAFPRVARDKLVTALSGTLTLGGTGLIRPSSVSGNDPEWLTSGSWTNHTHYISAAKPSSGTAPTATFTPGNTSAGVQITGTKVAVVSSGAPLSVSIDGVIVGNTANTADGVLSRFESGLLSDAAHVVVLTPTVVGTMSNIFGCDVYKDAGIRCHDLAQGGAKAGGGTGQSYWGDVATAAPTNMTNCYKQPVVVKSSKLQPDAHFIFLGGNDSNAGSDAATIAAAQEAMGLAYDGANTDIILMPDVWTADRELALMDICIDNGWAMIDFFWLSRALTEIFGGGYNGDQFGHLNSTRSDGGQPGDEWAADMVKNAFLYNPV